MKNTYQIYKGKDGFRWRLLSSNGRILADSGESYKRKAGLYKALKSITTRSFQVKEV